MGYLVYPLDVPKIADRLENLVHRSSRRRFTRYPNRLSIKMSESPKACLVTGVSRGGMFLSTSIDLPAQSVHPFELALPDSGEVLTVTAESLYRTNFLGSTPTGVGLCFRSFGRGDEAALIEYLRRQS